VPSNAYKTGGSLYSWETAHWLIIPMVAVVTFSLGLILVSQAADRVFNPRLRARHAESLESDEGGLSAPED
jgi:peptide/nickel transport system permease protein